MSALKLLKATSTLSDVAHLLGFKPKAVAYLIRKMWPQLRYTQFDIPKRSGGKRTISAPNKRLKLLQKRLAKILQQCELEIEKARGVKRRLAHGFKKNSSILTNADVHRGRRYVLNIDLSDFFGTINFGRVRGYLINNKDFALHPDAATVVAQIACHNNALPQGSPASPVISNLIANILDIRLAKLAKANGCSYTRYADDITFSTSKKDLSVDLIEPTPGSPHLWRPGSALIKAVQSCGFQINPKKTRLQYCRSRQDVTGLVVNSVLNTPIESRRLLRAMVHRLCSTGAFETRRLELDKSGNSVLVKKPGSLNRLEGMLNFSRHVEVWRQRDDVPPPEELTPSEKLLRQFLFYKEFAAARMPAVLFEGKTDSIYLKEALRQLAVSFPKLIASANPLQLRIRLHRYNENARRILDLPGGSEPLNKFIRTYPEKYRSIKGPKGANPVIVLLDNDLGAASILNLLKNKFGVVLSPGLQFFHVTDNLYVLLTSPVGGPPHYIEQLFDAHTLGTQLSGKTFNPLKNHNTATEYGKSWFAEKVVKANSKNINFGSFVPLLGSLDALVAAHSSAASPVGMLAQVTHAQASSIPPVSSQGPTP
jgi:retron-type reverse transcriptase